MSPEIEKYVEKTGWLNYNEVNEYYKKAKFIFLPNIIDASPRVLTEAFSHNLPAVINYNILGGWKYINDKTGEFFTNESDLEPALEKMVNGLKTGKYNPREYMRENYGPVISGKRLKEFLFENFRDRLNVKEDEFEYVMYPRYEPH